jgi:hypothetical protein
MTAVRTMPTPLIPVLANPAAALRHLVQAR